MTDQVESAITAVAAGVSQALPVVEGIVLALAPEAAPVLGIAVAVAKGVAAGVPEALALWNRFRSGDIPTQAELDAYAASEQTAYETLMADIEAKLRTA